MSFSSLFLKTFFISLIFASTLSAQNSPSPQVEGIYQSEKIGIIGNLRFYLRFYPDGTVLRTTSNLDQETPATVKKRLTRLSLLREPVAGTAPTESAQYRSFENAYYCTFGEGLGKISYEIHVIKNGLLIYSKGLIERKERYHFLPELAPPNQLGALRPTTQTRPTNIGVSSTVPKVYAVIVGVANYNHISSLRYTDDDAFRLYAFLKSPEGGALPDNQIALLIDEAAKRDAILAALRRMFSKASSKDVVLFYFSGHGAEGAFIPSDFDGTSNVLFHKSIRDIFDQSRAKHKVCIADACHSGSLDKGVKSGLPTLLTQYYASLESSTGGLALFMSSKAEETSLEVGGLRQSVFTYYLLEGLKGRADVNTNKIITIQELYQYVRREVMRYTANQQSPVINGNYDSNMPLGIVR